MNPTMLTIEKPLPYQIVQRSGFLPKFAHENHSGGPALGSGAVEISGTATAGMKGAISAKVTGLKNFFGKEADWQPLKMDWREEHFCGQLEVPAGGWYRLEVRIEPAAGPSQTACVEPFGVGEVFIVAGQSYVTNSHDAATVIEDPEGRITAYDPIHNAWRVANDPQPLAMPAQRSDTKLGSIWPSAMNALMPLLRVPIGMINVGVGGTASRQWVPGAECYDDLLRAGTRVGNFRSVLWQQGETDVMEATSAKTYKHNLMLMKRDTERHWRISRPWMLAKSTLHPVKYHDPEGEGIIRQAIDELWETPGFVPGPDTDILGGIGVHRAPAEASRHYTLLGQRRAGLLWFAALWHFLNQPLE